MAAAGTTDHAGPIKDLLEGIVSIQSHFREWKKSKKGAKYATKKRAKATAVRNEMKRVYDDLLKPARPLIAGTGYKEAGTTTHKEPLFSKKDADALLAPLDGLNPWSPSKCAIAITSEKILCMTQWNALQNALLKLSKSDAQSGSYNELDLFDDSFDYQYHDRIGSGRSLPFDDHNRYQPLISEEYNDVSGSGSPLLIGGVVGASAVVIIMLIFCLGLAFGMVICWGCSQQRALDVKREKEEMHWIDDENRNEV
eukprot:1027911_1